MTTDKHKEKMQIMIYNIFTKKYKLALDIEAGEYLIDYLESLGTKTPEAKIKQKLEDLAIFLFDQQLDEIKIIKEKDLKIAIKTKEISENNTKMIATKNLINFKDAFEIKKVFYNQNKNAFEYDLINNEKRSVMYYEAKKRQKILYDRLKYNKLRLKYKTDTIQYVTISGLIGLPKTNTFKIVCMITKKLGENIEVEDETGKIVVKNKGKNSKSNEYLVCVGNCVVLSGCFSKDEILIDSVEYPKNNKKIYQLDNAFNIDKETYQILNSSISHAYLKEKNPVLLFFSDVLLDLQKTFDRLEKVFETYQNDTQLQLPIAFVFMGSFVSSQYTYNGSDSKKYKQNIDKLAELITRFKRINENCNVIMQPGPKDPTFNTTYPNKKIPKYYTETFESKVQNSTFVSNPSFLQVCTNKITVFRYDYSSMFKKQHLQDWCEYSSKTFTPNIMRTIIDSGHLLPFSLYSVSISYNYDHCLWLDNPETLVVGNGFDSCHVNYNSTHCLVSGNFTESGTFCAYYPYSNTTEICQL